MGGGAGCRRVGGVRVFRRRRRRRPRRRRARSRARGSRRLHRGRRRQLAREARAARRPGRQLQRVRRRHGRRRVRVRPDPEQVVGRSRAAARQRVGRVRRRSPSGHLVTGGVDVGAGAQPAPVRGGTSARGTRLVRTDQPHAPGDPPVDAFATGVESAVVHYGDTTITFLNNWYRADQRGNPYQYVSAVAVEEKSVIDYNTGNPDGILDQGEEPREPRVPLVAIYPEEGTVYSDNPLFVLDAEWVDDRQREAAGAFVEYVQTPENQERVLEYGFRPGIADVPVAAPISEANGVNPATPQTLLDVPEPEVLAGLLDDWATQRKSARVRIVIDVSGSMGDEGDPETGATKLDLAKDAAITALEEFKDDDEVGLSVFSTELGPGGDQEMLELVPPTRVADVREQLANRIRDLLPTNSTPLYAVTQRAYEEALADFDPARINAVVLLSDGRNQDDDSADDRDQLTELIDTLQAGSEGQASRPVRVFPIAYGADADLPTLRQIAEATTAAVYDSSDPTSIDKVFTAVVSNF